MIFEIALFKNHISLDVLFVCLICVYIYTYAAHVEH